MRSTLLLALLLALPAVTHAQLMDDAALEKVRSSLPQLESADWNAALHSPRVVWYTHREMPPAYQNAGTFHSPQYNISADPSDSPIRHGEGGNANIQFPWRTAGGLDRSPTATTVTGLYLPAKDESSVWPVVVWRGTLPGHPGDGPESAWRWVFPRGAILFELIAHPVGSQSMTCEVRARLRLADDWSAGLFRPIPTAEDLAIALEREDRVRFYREIAQLRAPQPVSLVDVTDRANRTRAAYRGTAGVAFVPSLPTDVVTKLLSRPFVECTGGHWTVAADGTTCFAPTSADEHQLVPRTYMASLIGSDSESCEQCHKTVAVHARTFDRFRGWYGHVRGDDDTFSFHPVDPRVVSYSGARISPTLRPSLLRSGVIAVYDPATHPREIYRPLSPPAKSQR